jgi:hypothetical protein
MWPDMENVKEYFRKNVSSLRYNEMKMIDNLPNMLKC